MTNSQRKAKNSFPGSEKKPTLFSEFAFEAIGLYKNGCFYSQSMFGVPFEHTFINPTGVGRTNEDWIDGPIPGGVQKTLRLIVLLHETSHYLHDLSIGASMLCDYVHDLTSGLLTKGLQIISKRKSKIKLPLMPADRIKEWVADRELHDIAVNIINLETLVNNILGFPQGLITYCQKRSYFKDVLDIIPGLTGESIFEGLVAAKTVMNLSERIRDQEDVDYLEEIKHALHLFPEDLPPMYYTARSIFDAVMGHLLDPHGWKLEEIWPLRYENSPRLLSDLGFIYLADVALHIPPMHVITQRMQHGGNDLEDFIPAFRFCKALDSLRRRGGFPPADPKKSPEFFYITLFDYIAADPQLKWPTFKETNDNWIAFLWEFKKKRREAADGFRYRLVVEREKSPDTIVAGDPFFACLRQGAPIMHLTPTGFKLFMAMQTSDRLIISPMEWRDMAVLEMFQKNMPLWEDQPDHPSSDQIGEIYTREQNNAMLLHQEAIYRSICTELRSSLLYKNSFSCPFAPTGCTPGKPPCSNLKSLAGELDKNCCIRTYLAQDHINPACLEWDG